MIDYNVLSVGQCFQYACHSYIPKIFYHIDCGKNNFNLDFMYISGGNPKTLGALVNHTFSEVDEMFQIKDLPDNEGVKIKRTFRLQEYYLTERWQNLTCDKSISIEKYVAGKHFSCVTLTSNIFWLLMHGISLETATDLSIDLINKLREVCNPERLIVCMPYFRYNQVEKIGGMEEYINIHEKYIEKILETNCADLILRQDLGVNDMLPIIGKTGNESTKDKFHLYKGILFYVMNYIYYKAVFETKTGLPAEELMLKQNIIDKCNSTTLINNTFNVDGFAITREAMEKLFEISENGKKYIINGKR